MADSHRIDVLNRLLAIHYRSLPMYLTSAWPWIQPGDETAADVVAHIAADQRQFVERISDRLIELGVEGADIGRGKFPTAFTSLHDLSLSYLLPILIEYQKRDLAAIESLSRELPDDDLVQEALGAAQAHVESLEEVSSRRAAETTA